MVNRIEQFIRIARNAHRFTENEDVAGPRLHPFCLRNIHSTLPKKVRNLFDDGHYAEATFETFKFIDKTVQRHSRCKESGFKLMMDAFNEQNPLLKVTSLKDASETDEQRGFQFLFGGAVLAIRNPRGHEVDLHDDPDTCLDHLAFGSLLLRRLEQSGFI